MSEYTVQAREFLEKAKAKIIFDELEEQKSELFDDGKYRRTWKITIKRDGKQYSFKFYGNLIGDSINEYDVLACIQKYDIGSFDDFLSEFGYEIESNKDYYRVMKTYKAVSKEYKNVNRLFGDVIEELSGIA